MKTIIMQFSLAVVMLVSASFVQAQMTLDASLTVEELVLEYFSSGTLVEISDVTFNEVPGNEITVQLALFSNGLADGFPIDSGMVLTTGNAEQVISYWGLGSHVNDFVDEDLNSLMEDYPVRDCGVLEFDVTVMADALIFNYVFASIEYESFTCSRFNDVFGLFVSGPGIEGPFLNQAENIATIPNSDIPVMINTVNSGISGTGSFYVNESYCEEANPNWQSDTQYYNANPYDSLSNMHMPGFTDVFQAYTETTYGETYHLKLSICDVADGMFDSAVFFGDGTLQGIMINNTEEDELKSLRLFPNPATDVLNIQSDAAGQSQFNVLDVQGRLVKSISSNGAETVTIPIQDMDLGFYIINQYVDGGLVARSKFVKE